MSPIFRNGKSVLWGRDASELTKKGKWKCAQQQECWFSPLDCFEGGLIIFGPGFAFGLNCVWFFSTRKPLIKTRKRKEMTNEKKYPEVCIPPYYSKTPNPTTGQYQQSRVCRYVATAALCYPVSLPHNNKTGGGSIPLQAKLCWHTIKLKTEGEGEISYSGSR